MGKRAAPASAPPKDFKRLKAKVGKRAPKKLNATETTIKSRTIRLLGQRALGIGPSKGGVPRDQQKSSSGDFGSDSSDEEADASGGSGPLQLLALDSIYPTFATGSSAGSAGYHDPNTLKPLPQLLSLAGSSTAPSGLRSSALASIANLLSNRGTPNVRYTLLNLVTSHLVRAVCETLVDDADGVNEGGRLVLSALIATPSSSSGASGSVGKAVAEDRPLRGVGAAAEAAALNALPFLKPHLPLLSTYLQSGVVSLSSSTRANSHKLLDLVCSSGLPAGALVASFDDGVLQAQQQQQQQHSQHSAASSTRGIDKVVCSYLKGGLSRRNVSGSAVKSAPASDKGKKNPKDKGLGFGTTNYAVALRSLLKVLKCLDDSLESSSRGGGREASCGDSLYAGASALESSHMLANDVVAYAFLGHVPFDDGSLADDCDDQGLLDCERLGCFDVSRRVSTIAGGGGGKQQQRTPKAFAAGPATAAAGAAKGKGKATAASDPSLFPLSERLALLDKLRDCYVECLGLTATGDATSAEVASRGGGCNLAQSSREEALTLLTCMRLVYKIYLKPVSGGASSSRSSVADDQALVLKHLKVVNALLLQSLPLKNPRGAGAASSDGDGYLHVNVELCLMLLETVEGTVPSIYSGGGKREEKEAAIVRGWVDAVLYFVREHGAIDVAANNSDVRSTPRLSPGSSGAASIVRLLERIVARSGGDGSYIMARDERLDLVCAFYGFDRQTGEDKLGRDEEEEEEQEEEEGGEEEGEQEEEEEHEMVVEGGGGEGRGGQGKRGGEQEGEDNDENSGGLIGGGRKATMLALKIVREGLAAFQLTASDSSLAAGDGSEPPLTAMYLTMVLNLCLRLFGRIEEESLDDNNGDGAMDCLEATIELVLDVVRRTPPANTVDDDGDLAALFVRPVYELGKSVLRIKASFIANVMAQFESWLSPVSLPSLLSGPIIVFEHFPPRIQHRLLPILFLSPTPPSSATVKGLASVCASENVDPYIKQCTTELMSSYRSSIAMSDYFNFVVGSIGNVNKVPPNFKGNVLLAADSRIRRAIPSILVMDKGVKVLRPLLPVLGKWLSLPAGGAPLTAKQALPVRAALLLIGAVNQDSLSRTPIELRGVRGLSTLEALSEGVAAAGKTAVAATMTMRELVRDAILATLSMENMSEAEAAIVELARDVVEGDDGLVIEIAERLVVGGECLTAAMRLVKVVGGVQEGRGFGGRSVGEALEKMCKSLGDTSGAAAVSAELSLILGCGGGGDGGGGGGGGEEMYIRH